MATHVALLRGINVGGGGKVPMADLRTVVAGLGHSDVATYIQTGNIIFTPSHDDNDALACELQDAINSSFGVNTSAVVLTRAELAKVIDANPYPDEPNPRWKRFPAAANRGPTWAPTSVARIVGSSSIPG